MALLKPGDRIAVDALTYPGLKTVASMLNIRLVSIEMDGSGMLPDALAAACRREAIRALYLMPEVQNPTTSSLPDDRREAIAGIVERHDLILLEDDAYADTREKRNAALSARLPDNALFFGGISKVFGAGLRVSFLAAPARWRNALERAILATVWMASPFCSAIVSGIIADGGVEALLRAKREEARRRAAVAAEKLDAWRFLCPPSGFFGWLELPRSWSGKEFELAAAAAGVRVFCAEKFAVGKDTPAAVRLSLSGPETIDDLSRGLDILAKILAEDRREGDGVF
jgi:DNA-binding transcriptional MocR family regulator